MVNAEERLKLYFNALNAFDLKQVEAMFAEDAVYVSAGLNAMKIGRAEIMKSFHEYFSEYSDQVSLDDRIIQTGPNVFQSHWQLSATSSKTEKSLHRKGTQITTFNDDGLIAHVEVHDQT